MIGICKHIILTLKHKYFVFVNAMHLGIPWRGVIHDLSKFSLEELLPSGKYYQGIQSPQVLERNDNDDYSRVSVHHVGRNKHHWQYWVDYRQTNTLVYCIPYTYAMEYVCDSLAASRVYGGKDVAKDNAYQYFVNYADKCLIHPSIKRFIASCLKEYSVNGFDGLTREYTRKVYDECAGMYPRVIRIPTNTTGLEWERV
ncbi:MAG: hypothetical protein E7191_08705 [Erysipelotrichaceae bacterium]|nr:hypothetical protein [Erysipelotrichaceae bacterium]